MTRVFFTADSHFGHANVIGMCQRPFASIREHDDALIANWNEVVQPHDTVFHLGDFSYRCDAKHTRRCFDALNGTKYLVLGNHDHKGETTRLPWASQSQMMEVSVGGQTAVLCHYSMRTWRNQRRGFLQLYGHSHGRLPGSGQSIDVGVDVFGFTPVTLPEIKSRLAMLPALDFRDDTDAIAQLEEPDDTGHGI